MTQPGGYAGVAQTHGPTVAGAMEDVAMDEMPAAALDIVRRDGEPSQGVMNEGAWEDEGGGFPGTISWERVRECTRVRVFGVCGGCEGMNEGAWEDEGVGFPGTISCEGLYVWCEREGEGMNEGVWKTMVMAFWYCFVYARPQQFGALLEFVRASDCVSACVCERARFYVRVRVWCVYACACACALRVCINLCIYV